MGTDEGPGGCLTSRAHIVGMGTDEGPGGLLTSRAHVASAAEMSGINGALGESNTVCPCPAICYL